MTALARIIAFTVLSTLLFAAALIANEYVTLVFSARCTVSQWLDIVGTSSWAPASAYGFAVLIGGFIGWSAYRVVSPWRQLVWAVGLAVGFAILRKLWSLYATALFTIDIVVHPINSMIWFTAVVIASFSLMRLLARGGRPTGKKGPWDR